MRSASRRQLVLAGGAIIALVAGVLLVTRGDFVPERHDDGQGPLASLSSVTETFSILGTYTVALPLCRTNDYQPAMLDGTVAPHTTVGPGLRYLGSYVRSGIAPDFKAIGSLTGFPPPVPYTGLHAEKGFAIESRCEDARHQDGKLYTELVLGLAPVASNGGGWLGIDVGYYSGWRHHVVTIPWAFVICGPGLPGDVENCPPPSGA
jgi:hypothetical protein